MPAEASFELRASSPQNGPVLLSSPHSGRLYPRRLLEILNLSLAQLRPLDDGPVDLLLEPALPQAAGLVAALLPRVWIDLNRGPGEIDPACIGLDPASPAANGCRPSDRVRAGLGLVPSRLAGRAILRRKLAPDELAERLSLTWRPFHAALHGELGRLVDRFGAALLVDCHSMPHLPLKAGWRDAEIVVGDRFGTTCDPRLSELAVAICRRHGFRAVRNTPYAGGHITESHGRPALGRHALQLEIRRDLFLDEPTYRMHAGAGRVAAAITELVAEAADLLVRTTRKPAAA